MSRIAAALLAATVGVACSSSVAPAETPLHEDTPFALRWPAGELTARDELGAPAWRVRTLGDAEANFAASAQTLDPPLDLRGRYVKVWLAVDALARLGGVELRLGSHELQSFYAFPLPLYDDPDANLLRDDTWTPFTFDFAAARVEGTPDRAAIEAIGFYVADRGGDAPVEVAWSRLASVPAPKAGVVSLTFDDGYAEHRTAASWMAAHDFRGTAYVIPDAIGEPGYLTLAELHELQGRFGWEIAAHHQTPFTDFANGGLEKAVRETQRYLNDNGFFRGASHLAYPLGKQDPETVRPLVRRRFTTARIAVGGVETLPPADPHLLRVLNVTNETRPEEIGDLARRVRESGGWLILMFHYLVDAPKLATEYGLGDFREALREIAAADVRVLPVGEVFEECCSRQAPSDGHR